MADPVDRDIPCERCRYNLRSLAKSTVCPECGAAVKNSVALWSVRQRRLERQRDEKLRKLTELPLPQRASLTSLISMRDGLVLSLVAPVLLIVAETADDARWARAGAGRATVFGLAVTAVVCSFWSAWRLGPPKLEAHGLTSTLSEFLRLSAAVGLFLPFTYVLQTTVDTPSAVLTVVCGACYPAATLFIMLRAGQLLGRRRGASALILLVALAVTLVAPMMTIFGFASRYDALPALLIRRTPCPPFTSVEAVLDLLELSHRRLDDFRELLILIGLAAEVGVAVVLAAAWWTVTAELRSRRARVPPSSDSS